MAGTIKGMTIEIGGNTTPLEQSLKSVNKEIKGTQKELNEVNKLLKLDPKNVDLLKQKQQILGEQIGNTTTKLDALKQAQAQLDAEMKKGGDVNQQEYRKLQREIMTTENSLQKLKDANKQNNKELTSAKLHLTDVANGLKKVGDAVAPVAKAFANFTVAGIKAMAGATTTAVTALGTLAVKAGALADDLNTLSAVTGLSTKELQEFQYASDLIDVSVDTLSGALKKTTQAMNSARSGTGTSAEAFKKLGVSITDAQGNLRDNNDVFNDAIRALGNIGNETERDALAMQIFGKSASELNPLIEGGIDTLEKMGKQANELGLILSQDALDGANAFNDQIDILKANGRQTFQVIGTEIASQLVPAMEQLNAYTMNVIKSLTSAMETGGLEGLAEELTTQIGNMISKFGENLPKVAEFGMQIIKKLVESIKQNASSLGGAGANLVTTLIEGLYTLLPDIIRIAIDFVVGFGKTLAENLPTLIPIVQQGVFDALNALIENLPLIIETIVDIIVAIVDAMTQPECIEMLIEGSITLMVALAEGLVKAIPKLIEAIPTIVMALVRGFISFASELYKIASPFLTALKDGIINAVTILKEAVSSIWEYIKTTLTNAFKGVVSIGRNLIEGLWNGIKNAKDWLIGKIKSFCSDALRSNQKLLWY